MPNKTLRLPFPVRQGQHIAIIGDTGSGKSTLASKILLSQPYLIVLKTKPDTVKYQALKIKKADKTASLSETRFLLEPDYEQQALEGAKALDLIWKQGGWTVYLDELFYADKMLGLTPFIDRLLTQGRSKGITVVTGMQRPSLVTRFAIAESTHVIVFGLEGRDTKTIGESASKKLESAVSSLRRFEFAWFYRPSRELWTGRYQDLEQG